VESYRYSAFGVETIFDADGVIQATSRVNNPWRYAGNRVDSRTGLVHFTYRDYDPQLKRWIQPPKQ
jgi:RHS repeat-associated protein